MTGAITQREPAGSGTRAGKGTAAPIARSERRICWLRSVLRWDGSRVTEEILGEIENMMVPEDDVEVIKTVQEISTA